MDSKPNIFRRSMEEIWTGGRQVWTRGGVLVLLKKLSVTFDQKLYSNGR